jgi:hypothetical protein
MTGTCANCIHFRPFDGDKVEYSSCRRYPPVVVAIEEFQGFAFPEVDLTDY